MVRCNCSICTKKGVLHHRVAADRFRVVAGEEHLGLYQFGTGRARHHFCRVCGIHPFSNPRTDPDTVMINVRCLDDFDLDAGGYEVVEFDGRDWERAAAALGAAHPLEEEQRR